MVGEQRMLIFFVLRGTRGSKIASIGKFRMDAK